MLVAPLALSVGFVTGLLRDYGGVLTPLFVLGVGYPFAAERKAALLWLVGFTLAEAFPYFQAPTSHELLRALSTLGALGGAFTLFALIFLFEPPWTRLLAWGALEAFLWEGLGLTLLDLGTGLVDSSLALIAALGGAHLASVVAGGLGALGWRHPVLILPLSLLVLLPFPQGETGNKWTLVVQGGQRVEAKEVNWQKGENPYPTLTESALRNKNPPVLVVWPEAASPLPYFGAGKITWIGGVGGAGMNAVYLTEGRTVVVARPKVYPVPVWEQTGWSPHLHSQTRLQVGLRVPQGNLPKRELKPLGRFGALISHEAVRSLPASKLAAMGAELLVVVTNEAAFEGTLLKRRRLRQDRLRAVETGLWVVRAAETGPSGSIDPRGHPAFLSPEGKRGAWLVPFEYRKSQTPYVGLVRALTGGGMR
jgi:apolipoprotein N-acyltransferase